MQAGCDESQCSVRSRSNFIRTNRKPPEKLQGTCARALSFFCFHFFGYNIIPHISAAQLLVSFSIASNMSSLRICTRAIARPAGSLHALRREVPRQLPRGLGYSLSRQSRFQTTEAHETSGKASTGTQSSAPPKAIKYTTDSYASHALTMYAIGDHLLILQSTATQTSSAIPNSPKSQTMTSSTSNQSYHTPRQFSPPLGPIQTAIPTT